MMVICSHAEKCDRGHSKCKYGCPHSIIHEGGSCSRDQCTHASEDLGVKDVFCQPVNIFPKELFEL